MIRRWPRLSFCIGEPATAIQFRVLGRLILKANSMQS